MLDKKYVRSLYALAAGCGLSVHSEDRSDDLHALISAEAGKESCKELTVTEYKKLEKRLLNQMRGMPKNPKPRKTAAKKPDPVPGMITGAQIKYVYYLMNMLCDLDPRDKSFKERLCGVIHKSLGVDSPIERPFAWVKMKDASKLIKILQEYIASAERKVMKEGVSGGY